MGSWMPSWFAYLLIAAAGMLAHVRLHRALPAQLRPAAGTMAAAMLGMLAGLAIDASRGRLVLLASLCGAGLPLGSLLRWHLDLLAPSNAALALAGLLPVLWRLRAGPAVGARAGLLPSLLCVGLMLAGMNLGMPLLVHARAPADAAPGAATLLAAMQAGMAGGSVAALLLLRAVARGPASLTILPRGETETTP